MKILKKSIIFITLFSIVLTNNTYASTCYRNWYRTINCSKCDDNDYDSSKVDKCAGKHKRQYGIKLCSTHRKSISIKSSYYKRGYSDYNCLAYALGKNSVQSWTWPSSWGSSGPTLNTFKQWILEKGYTYTTVKAEANARGKNIIYVYAITKNGTKYIQHFSRKYTMNGKSVDGAATISKWGACSLYTTSTKNPYASTSGYGSLVLICYK